MDKNKVESWAEIIVFVASIYFAIMDQYSAATFGVLVAIYISISRK